MPVAEKIKHLGKLIFVVAFFFITFWKPHSI